jgi:hypothetical protein
MHPLHTDPPTEATGAGAGTRTGSLARVMDSSSCMRHKMMRQRKSPTPRRGLELRESKHGAVRSHMCQLNAALLDQLRVARWRAVHYTPADSIDEQASRSSLTVFSFMLPFEFITIPQPARYMTTVHNRPALRQMSALETLKAIRPEILVEGEIGDIGSGSLERSTSCCRVGVSSSW